MKKGLLLVYMLALSTLGFAQQKEYSLHLNTGWLRFGGESAAKTSALILGSGRSDINYTDNPYGKKAGLGYDGTVQVQKVSAKNLLFGLQAGYEILRSKVPLTHAYTLVSSATAPAVSGETVLRHRFINTYPFMGKRWVLSKTTVDLTAGLNLGFNVKSHEKGAATDAGGQIYRSNKDLDKLGLDTRARVGITACYQKFGLTAGYAHGLKNYTPETEGANRQTFARLMRLGLVYRI
jgi:hypothetical protein